MANKDSTLVTNFEATPATANPVHQLHGRKRVAQGTIALVTGDLTLADTVMLAPVPSNASITSIKIATDDLDGGTSLLWNLGLYNTDLTAADADCYATDATWGQAATSFTEVAWEARDINETGQKVYEDAGASSDPGGYYYVGLVVDTAPATAAAGDIAFIIEYVVD